MKTYARVIAGAVSEIVCDFTDENGVYFPIEKLYPADFVAELVDVTSVTPQPEQNWVVKDAVFLPPVPPALNSEQIVAINTAQQASLMAAADLANYGKADAFVADLLDAADTTTFKAWATYKLALSKVDLTQQTPTWPAVPST